MIQSWQKALRKETIAEERWQLGNSVLSPRKDAFGDLAVPRTSDVFPHGRPQSLPSPRVQTPVCYLLGLREAVESWAWPALGGGMEQVWTDTVMAGAFC